MATRCSRRLVGCALTLSLLLSGGAQATDTDDKTSKTPPKTAASAFRQSYVWYDGDQAQTVWLDPNLVADFTRRPPHEGALKRAFPRAQELARRHAGMRLWRADGRVGAAETLRTLAETAPAADYSPVLRDGPSEDASVRALPGNIIVYFQPDWDEGVVAAWVQARGLTIVKRLEVGRNVYVIETAPGLASLEIANSLYLSGEVVAAFPDWWRELVPR